MMSSCDVCNRRFGTGASARDHKKATGHCVCEHCCKVLGSTKGLEDHKNAVHNHKCPQCATIFTRVVLLKNHQKAKNHCYCGDCNKAFGSSSALTSHLQSSRHSTEFRCCDCDRDFSSSDALDQHLRDKVHRRPAATHTKFTPSQPRQQHGCGPESPYLCTNTKCSRRFRTPKSLLQHLESLAHRPLSKLPCIASASCTKSFPSPSALLHHLESGACSSGMNYEEVKAIVIEQDTDGLVTKTHRPIHDMLQEVSNELRSGSPRRMAAWDAGSEILVSTPSSSSSQVCWTPEDGSVKDWAMTISKSSHHRCPFCDPGRRPFPTQQSLQDHLLSAAHREPFVFCPANLAVGKLSTSKVIRTFTTVSGLLQHLESGTCSEGITGFWKTVRYLENRLRMWGLNFMLTINDSEDSR